MADSADSSAASASPVRRNLTLDLVDTVTERLGVASAIIEVVRDRVSDGIEVDTLLAEASNITNDVRALVNDAWREAAQ